MILLIAFFALLLLNKSSNLTQMLLGKFVRLELTETDATVNTRETVMRLLPAEGSVLSVQPHSYMIIDPERADEAVSNTAPISDAHALTANGYTAFYQQQGRSLKLYHHQKEL